MYITLHSFEYLDALVSQCVHVSCHLQEYRNSEQDAVLQAEGTGKVEATDRPAYLLLDHREALHLQVGSLQCCPGLDEAGLHRLQAAAKLLLPQRHG